MVKPVAALLFLLACTKAGPAGQDGAPGADGVDGTDGVNGVDGADGADADSPCVSVTGFGAVGDGVTDDTLAIQAAIDSLPTWTDYGVSSAGRVCLPAGTYRVTSTIEVPDFVTLRGEGMFSTLLVADPAAEPMSVFARKGENAQKNVMFFDMGVFITHADSVAFDLTFMTRAVIERCLVYNPDYEYANPSRPAAGTGVYMEADGSHSGYDNRVLNNEMWGVSVGVHVGPSAHAAAIQNNTITGGDWAVYVSAEGSDLTDNVRITSNRFEAMNEGFLHLGGQDALVENNRFEAYNTDGLSAAIWMSADSRWNVVGYNYLSLASTPAAEVHDEGTNNSWRTYYTRILESRGSGDNLEYEVVRVGDDLSRGLTISGTYVALGATVRVDSRSETLSSGGSIDPSGASHVEVTGPASNVTLNTTGTATGALLFITGSGSSVEIVSGTTADLAGDSVSIGGDSGDYSGITLIYAPSGQWVELSRSGQRP